MKLRKLNKKAQSTGLPGLGIAFMVALFIFLIGMVNINFIKDEVTRARGVDQLNCYSDSISDGGKVTCLLVDIVVPFFIIIIFAAAGGILTAKLLM